MGKFISELHDVSKVYKMGVESIHALDNVRLNVEKGDYMAVMGPSGSGKSTLLNVMGAIDQPTSGEIYLDGERIDNMDEKDLLNVHRKKVAYIFQEARLFLSLNAMENVMLPLILSGNSTKEKKDLAIEMLKRVGLEKRAYHMPHELSGGEAQRVCIARMLITNPLLVLADEPTGNLDSKTGDGIMELFEQLNEEGLTIVMVTHDPERAKHARRVINIRDGRIIGDECKLK
jgi:putative ABC transport system ATP-binding protein